MKYLILFLLPITSYAQNYFPVGKDGANTTYVSGSECEKIEAFKCWEVSKIESSLAKIDLVDDLSKPNYAKENVAACTDQDDCQTKLETHVCARGNKLINELYTEVYCAFITSYEKKEDVVLDLVKVAEKEAARLAKEQEEQTRSQKENERLIALKSCLSGDPKDKVLQDCLKILIREALNKKLSVGELSVQN